MGASRYPSRFFQRCIFIHQPSVAVLVSCFTSSMLCMRYALVYVSPSVILYRRREERITSALWCFSRNRNQNPKVDLSHVYSSRSAVTDMFPPSLFDPVIPSAQSRRPYIQWISPQSADRPIRPRVCLSPRHTFDIGCRCIYHHRALTPTRVVLKL